MGIPGFLPDVLKMAGREVDLRDFADGILDAPQLAQAYKENTVKRRKLRIGVDISHWLWSANMSHGHLLADDRHLTNHGRASLIQEQKTKSTAAAVGGKQHDENSKDKDDNDDLPDNVIEYISLCVKRVNEAVVRLQDATNSKVLVVFDGESPPSKGPEVQKRRAEREEYIRQRDKPTSPTLQEFDESEAGIKQRTKANRRAGAGPYFWIIRNELIHALRQVEIAFMVAPYEADSQLAYLSHQQYIDLIITEDSDLVAHGASPILFKSKDEILNNHVPRGIMLQFNDIGLVHKPKGFSFMDFSPVMMAVLFVAVGSDYCKKLEGIGIVTALKAVRKAFLEPRESSTQSGLSVLFEELFKGRYRYKKDGQEREKEYKEQFMLALLMYRHPIVYDPVQGKCIVVRDPVKLGGDPELMDHKPYAKLCRDETRIHQAIGILRDSNKTTSCIGKI
jgi:5'-3' exonuclease